MKPLYLTLLAAAAVAGSSFGQTQPDNTGTNARDRNGQHVTAGDQSNKAEDIKLTANIRKMVVDDKSLSATAKNAKIITIDEVVTLRGPVNSAAEKSTLEAHAKQAGAKKVVNELEVKNP